MSSEQFVVFFERNGIIGQRVFIGLEKAREFYDRITRTAGITNATIKRV